MYETMRRSVMYDEQLETGFPRLNLFLLDLLFCRVVIDYIRLLVMEA